MRYKIYPSIGIARVGNSASEFFVGPEIPGHPGIEIDGAGVETPVKQYKARTDQIKRQGARFRGLAPTYHLEWRKEDRDKGFNESKASVQRMANDG